ncbi:MAG TPA: hypothetical protein VHF69_00305, partial [Candidatus Synoicihabitans sp.]|nr:hypothetical protein [Candidatus Synoicihabitans sp.]
MSMNWPKQEIVIEWERDGAPEQLRFALLAKAGPRNGHMREYFEVGGRQPRPEDTPAGRLERHVPPQPPLAEEPITDPTRGDEALARVWALASRRRFAEARTQLQQLLSGPDPYGGVLEGVAEGMVRLARAHELDADPTVYDWLRTQAISLWYAWGSQATSGGEGACRAVKIRAAEAQLPEVSRGAVAAKRRT